jgi:hypothetical protein
MSIYATLWTIRIEWHFDEWIEVTAQSVPPHIDHHADWLPPPIPEDSGYPRAVVFVTEDAIKGTDRSGQEYRDPLLVITGKEYVEARFENMMQRLQDAVELHRSRSE